MLSTYSWHAREMTNEGHIELCRNVFANWSSGDPESNEALFHDDAVLVDIVAGTHEGWPAMQTFFARGVGVWPDLSFELHDFWLNDDGVACSWTMSATVTDDRFGPDANGKRWSAPGMSFLTIEAGKVRREADHWNSGSIAASLR
jgi:steroid delta-isomerase-like uncharacterized protein